MYLYKLEIQLETHTDVLIVLAENDGKAFDSVESHLARHYIATPKVKEMCIVERKRADKGTGYLVEGKE
jgi:hypothetical protein